MAIGVQVWSKTPATNATADTNISFPEGMAPSQLNDSARSLMASVADFRDDNNGTIVTAGTTLAFTATTNQIEAALTAGYTVAVQFHATNDAAATLAVDGLTAKPLQAIPGVNVPYGTYQAGSIQRFTYSSTGTGQWVAHGGNNAGVTAVFGPLNPTGTNSGTGAMMGMGSTFTFTPTRGSRCFIQITGYGLNTGATGSWQAQAYYGTGVAPVNAAAPAGTAVGATVVGYSAVASAAAPFCIGGIVTGLVIGTAYWVDAKVIDSGGTLSALHNVCLSAFEVF